MEAQKLKINKEEQIINKFENFAIIYLLNI